MRRTTSAMGGTLLVFLAWLFAYPGRYVSLLIGPIIILIIAIVIYIKREKDYQKSSYYLVTQRSRRSTMSDEGYRGEYLIYKKLKIFEEAGAKLLFNVYIPKENGKTTEIDVLMINEAGVFVFESKSYSGWIFGSENQKNWYQTLPIGYGGSQKESFYNPIMQNRTHIKHLKALLGEKVPMYSLVVFSDRCTLKSVQVKSDDVHVVYRNGVDSAVFGICNQLQQDLLNEVDITMLYNKLYPYSQVSFDTKAQHVANIYGRRTPQPIANVIPSTQEGAKSGDSSTETPKMKEMSPHKCPRCNGNLVLRTARRGQNAGNQFYGCSNYPKCYYIQNLPNKPAENATHSPP